MSTTQTPNMLLQLPVPGPASNAESGPAYANDNNAAFSAIDSHNHTTNQGVQIPPAGLNINTNLPFQGNSATGLNSTQYNGNATTASAAVYFSGGNLYINNGAGTAVQVTNGSSVNAGAGSITGLPSGTAGVTYSSNTYVFQKATSQAANIDAASYLMRTASSGSNALTLQPPSSLSSGNITLTLPAAAASVQEYLAIDTSGNITAYSPVAPNYVISSSSSGTFRTLSSSVTPITNMSAAVTTSGRPVVIMAQPDGSANNSYFYIGNSGNQFQLYIYRGATQIGYWLLGEDPSTTHGIYYPPSTLTMTDQPSAGSYTYTAQVSSFNGEYVYCYYMKLVAYEIK